MYGTNHEDEKKTQTSKIDGSNFHTLAREIIGLPSSCTSRPKLSLPTLQENIITILKLWKRKGKEGAYREFLDATDFALVGGDINGDGSFRRHLK
ncbi:hypothetical protein YC2023_087028 [Brassica napus]